MNQTLNRESSNCRLHLLVHAELNDAVEIVNQSLVADNDTLNKAEQCFATSLVARALLARGVIQTAAAWLADVRGMPLPDATAVMMSLLTDPPIVLNEIMLKEDIG